MSDKNLPCWSFPPDWSGGILEALEWHSSVAGSPNGAEQRRMLRLSPRRFIEMSCIGVGNERSTLDLAVWSAGGTRWNVPLHWDYAKLTAGVSAGAMALMLDPQYSEFEAGGLAFIKGPDATTFDVVEIASVASDRLNLAAPGTTRAWGLGTKVMPMREAEFTDQPQLIRHTDNVATYQCSFQVTEKNVFQAVPPTETYLGYRVFREPPNETGALSTQWTRMRVSVDNGTGVPHTVDTARYGFAHQQHEFFLHGRANNLAFRKLLYWLRGRVRPAWVPTFSIDMEMIDPMTSTATAFNIERVGVSQWVNMAVDPDHPEYAYPGRRHLLIHMRDGSAVFAYMTNAVDNLDGTETITISAPTGVNIDPPAIKRISFLALMRLDQDRVEINHHTDQKGVSQSTTTWVSTPENRQASLISPDEWNGVMDSSPCTLCEPPFSVRNDDVLYDGAYNPMAHEVWATTQGSVSPYNQVGYRFKASTLESMGAVLADNPDTSYEYVIAVYGDEGFIPDTGRGVMWAWGRIRINSTTTREVLMKFDALTGECLHAIRPTGSGINSGAVNWYVFVSPANGDIWLVCNVSGSIRFNLIDPDTLQPTSSFSVASNTFGSVAMDSLGHIWWTRIGSGATGREVWRFDGSLHTSAKVYDNPVDLYMLVPARERGSMWLINNLTADGMREFLDATAAPSGRVLQIPPFTGGLNCKYDPVNDLMWGLKWVGSTGGSGRFTAINLVDGAVWGTWEPRAPVETEIRDVTNSFSPPKIGLPNAIYLQDEGFRDEAETDYGYAMGKVPICNVVRA